FSIVIPTFKRPDFLRRCLAELTPERQQISADRYEVIVTDDAPSQVSKQAAEETLPGVIYIAGPGRGPAANRNSGARHARGRWLVFTDDDCIPEPGWLAAYADAIIPDIRVYEGKTTCKAGLRSALDHAPCNETGGYLWSCNFMVEALLFAEFRG